MPDILGWDPAGTGLRYEENSSQKASVKVLEMNLSL